MTETLPTAYQQTIFMSRYARYRTEESRRENIDETFGRYLDFMLGDHARKVGYHNRLPVQDLRDEILPMLMDQSVVPSMRALMTAGAALERSNVAGFNCSFLPVDSIHAFDEAMYILLCGTGVGFSVESYDTEKLPVVPEILRRSGNVIQVGDSKEGWALAFHQLLTELWAGRIDKYNTDAVRPAGSRLKTFGGRASGPGPLIELFEFTIRLFQNAAGRKLRPIECHDLMCKVAEVIVVGGVRRSALISLSDLNDRAMAGAKGSFPVVVTNDDASVVTIVNAYGEQEVHDVSLDDYHREQMMRTGLLPWYILYPHRQLANNSAVYEGRPNAETFLEEWTALVASKAGERGIFNREAVERQVSRNGRRKTGFRWGTNPCSEIILRPYQLCNLSSVLIRATDTLEQLLAKVRVAAILGTLQSTLTDLPYLRDIWRENTAEERLLGVSLTGLRDHPVLGQNSRTTVFWLRKMREEVVRVNAELAEQMGIPASTATTCVKPEGTVSQYGNTSSGMHERFAQFYIRTIRQDNKDPVTEFLKAAGVPWEPCVSKPDTTTVFSFPIASPPGATTRHDTNALEQLEYWLMLQEEWCEHEPSATIYVRDEEWMAVGAWVYGNFERVSGIAFLPSSDHIYRQAPYQEIDEATYREWLAKVPETLPWEHLPLFELEDSTVAQQQLACSAGVCEI